MSDIYSSDRLEGRLLRLLDEQNPRDRVYVYRLDGERKIKPAVFKGRPFPELEDYLSAKYDGGDFYLMIRRGTTLQIAGTIRLATPLSR
jgi:hypothetical protein